MRTDLDRRTTFLLATSTKTMVAVLVLAGAALVADLEAHTRGWIFFIALVYMVADGVIVDRWLSQEQKKLEAILRARQDDTATNEELARASGLSLSVNALRTEHEMSTAPESHPFIRDDPGRREAHVVHFPPRARSPRS